MEPKTVVALEIASSKIKGAVGTFDDAGHLTVLAVDTMPAINNVRHGRVQNIREVSDAVAEILDRLQCSREVAPARICGAVVGVGGRSVMSTPTTASLRFQHECEITDALVKRLGYEATRDYVGERVIIGTMPRMFYVNNIAVKKPVGNVGETMRAEYTLVTCAKETRKNLDRVSYGDIDSDHIYYTLRASAVADFVLSSDEREVGCALVDFGAETCTVTIYREGTMCFLSTIPMGSRLITLDIMAGLGVTEEAAENFKTTLGTLAEDAAGGVNASEISGYVRARAGEIAANILNQITVSGYEANISKIVLVGSGALLPEFPTMLSRLAKVPVRVAEMPGEVSFRSTQQNNADNIDVVALLWAGRRASIGQCVCQPLAEIKENDALVAGTTVLIAETPEVAETVETESLFDDDETIAGRADTDEDESLLHDDPDDPDDSDDTHETTAKESGKNRLGLGSLFGFGKSKKHAVREEPEEEPEPSDNDQTAIEDEEPIEPSEPVEPEINKISRAVEGMRSSFVKFFTAPEEDEDDDDDEDDDQ